MRVEVLGSLRVSCRDGSPNLGAARSRAALAWLVMNANTDVGFDSLAAVVWQQPPADAPHRLRMLLLSLAIELPPGTLQVDGVVHLVLADGAVDADRFTDLIRDGYRHWADGEYERARANIEDALGMWRGAPYPDLARCMSAAEEIRRLIRLRLRAVELQQESMLLGAVDFAGIADLQYLVASHPDRRAFRLQQARALSAAGRQVEALAVLRQAAADLGDHPVTSQLMTLILHRDPAAAALPTIDASDRTR